RPAVRLRLGVEITANLDLAAGAELERYKVGRASPQALADVVAGDHKVLAIVALAAHQEVDVEVVGVPVIDRNPIEEGGQGSVGLRHGIPGEGLEISEPLGVLR